MTSLSPVQISRFYLTLLDISLRSGTRRTSIDPQNILEFVRIQIWDTSAPVLFILFWHDGAMTSNNIFTRDYDIHEYFRQWCVCVCVPVSHLATRSIPAGVKNFLSCKQ